MRPTLSLVLSVGLLALGPTACGQQPGPGKTTPAGRLAAVEVGEAFDPKSLGVKSAWELLEEAGYSPGEIEHADLPSMQSLAHYGRKDVATKVLTGDQFDRAEGRAEAERREKVGDFTSPDLGYDILENDGLRPEADGVDLSVPVPLLAALYYEPSLVGKGSGVIQRVYPCDTDEGQLAYYTKDNTLRPCSWGDAVIVRELGGTVYCRESAYTRVIVRVGGDLTTLKDIARSAGKYKVHLLFSDLAAHWSSFSAWFREDALREQRRDTARLIVLHRMGHDAGVKPYYFEGERRADPGDLPAAARAYLRGVVIVDDAAKVVGKFEFVAKPKEVRPLGPERPRPAK